MPIVNDGPASALFTPLTLAGNITLEQLTETEVSAGMLQRRDYAPVGECVGWGIPFSIQQLILLREQQVAVTLEPFTAGWLVFQHTTDQRPNELAANGLPLSKQGNGWLGDEVADYIFIYQDGREERVTLRRQHGIAAFAHNWGDNCFRAVAHHKPFPILAQDEQQTSGWGWSQTRVQSEYNGPWVNWLWAWENPHPEIPLVGLRFEPKAGTLLISAISAGAASAFPLRWETRRKALLRLPAGVPFDPKLNENGQLAHLRLDLGQVISAIPRALYPDAEAWETSDNNCPPTFAPDELLIEYTAHPDAAFHLADGTVIPVRALQHEGSSGALAVIKASWQRVALRVTEHGSSTPVAVKLHVHGEAGEYLAPLDRHRLPNPAWFEDYSVDFTHQSIHHCTYITGETLLNLPCGRVFIEVSKGFEIRPLRKVVEVTPETTEINLELERVLPWRERGWVTADTHVHFLSPPSAGLEGAGEGINVVNLLASQWGELMTNVGDFDGKTTFGSREAGGVGEYLVRVGTENRQHILGHISLLGYQAPIVPMTTGGPDEAALGDPIEVLLTEWAARCKAQGGVVVLPHFPAPRAEHAASIVSGNVDAVEMTCWGSLYNGINPYSLVDWYRYLNCGYLVAAVGGTDKMSANTAVGTVRTYARLRPNEPFTYTGWQEAVRRAETFVTYGPLLEFSVDGRPPGGRIALPAGGGTVEVTWSAASVTVPMSRVELVVNGEIRESLAVNPTEAGGHWSVKVDGSCWLALLVRGHYSYRPEIITAHSSPVFVEVAQSPLLAPADALTILEQIEGALAYLDTIGTRAETTAYQRMRLVLTSAHRGLHNRMHEQGNFHKHTPVENHPGH